MQLVFQSSDNVIVSEKRCLLVKKNLTGINDRVIIEI